MPDLAVSNDTEIIAEVQKTAEILMIFKVHTYGEQTVDQLLWISIDGLPLANWNPDRAISLWWTDKSATLKNR